MRCQTEIVGRVRKEGQSVSGNVVTGAAFGVTTIIRIARGDSCVRLVGYPELIVENGRALVGLFNRTVLGTCTVSTIISHRHPHLHRV